MSRQRRSSAAAGRSSGKSAAGRTNIEYSYRNSVQGPHEEARWIHAHRIDDRRAAQSAMMEIANRERQAFVSNRAFQDEAELAFTLPTELTGKYTYTITVDNAASPPTFVINFDSIGAQAADGDLSLNSSGVKSPAEKW
jgi:type IV pilus assembly protein PilE